MPPPRPLVCRAEGADLVVPMVPSRVVLKGQLCCSVPGGSQSRRGSKVCVAPQPVRGASTVSGAWLLRFPV
jgi:hypothetical protein